MIDLPPLPQPAYSERRSWFPAPPSPEVATRESFAADQMRTYGEACARAALEAAAAIADETWEADAYPPSDDCSSGFPVMAENTARKIRALKDKP